MYVIKCDHQGQTTQVRRRFPTIKEARRIMVMFARCQASVYKGRVIEANEGTDLKRLNERPSAYVRTGSDKNHERWYVTPE